MSLTPNTAATRDELIRLGSHWPLITARAFCPRLPYGVEIDDLVAAGNLGLCKAADQFDSTRGAQFATYAITLIRGEMREMLRQWDFYSRAHRDKISRGVAPEHMVTSLDAHVSIGESEGRETMGDLLAHSGPGPEEIALQRAQSVELAAIVESLPEREREVLRAKCGGATHKEIGERLGVSESRAYQLYQRALKIVRQDARLLELFA